MYSWRHGAHLQGRNQGLAGVQQLNFVEGGRGHLQQHVGLEDFFGRVGNLGAGFGIGVVGVLAGLAGAGFHEHFVAFGHEVLHGFGRQADAVFLQRGFAGQPDEEFALAGFHGQHRFLREIGAARGQGLKTGW